VKENFIKMSTPIHVISLGAGVQSSAMSLMAKHGEITPMPKAAVFADTGGEPQVVYKWLDWLEKQLPFPVYRVTNGNLKEDIIKASKDKNQRLGSAPFFVSGSTPTGSPVKGMIRRVCTSEYKINPVTKKMRELAGLVPRQRAKELLVIEWQGISLDEIQRSRMDSSKWRDLRYPLIEKRTTRFECLEWMKEKGYPEPPRSACTFCPYHSDIEWRRLKNDDKESFKEAVEIDKIIRDGFGTTTVGNKLFLHRSLQPLDEVDFRNAEDFGQEDMFADLECEGMCGM
tara:strand:+ start:284 stop:1138 length:855 start_codon:yes stop_codon:yes gene_type:complete